MEKHERTSCLADPQRALNALSLETISLPLTCWFIFIKSEICIVLDRLVVDAAMALEKHA
jgi:hypothetical protein